MPIRGFDHVALPTANPFAMIRFYRALGFSAPDPDTWAAGGQTFFSVHFGDERINFHAPALWQRPDFDLRGPTAKPGCGDLCFVWEGTMEEILRLLEQADAAIVAGPMDMVGGRDGSRARGSSVYTRDPDGNLIEFIVYEAATGAT